MRYSIGEVSRVLGLTTSALHFYEKEGVIDTPKVDSGRRYYQAADINRLISAKKYRAMGVPVRDIAQQFSADGMTGAQVVARIREKRDEALAFARMYEGLAGDIDRLIAVSEHGLAHAGVVDIRPVGDMLMLSDGEGGLIPHDKAAQDEVRRWLEAMPAVSLSICRDPAREKAVHTLMIPLRRAADFGLEADGRAASVVPGGMALHAVIACGEEQYEQPDTIFRAVLAFACAHRFVQKGVMWGNQTFVDCSCGVRRHYFDTYMVFE